MAGVFVLIATVSVLLFLVIKEGVKYYRREEVIFYDREEQSDDHFFYNLIIKKDLTLNQFSKN